VLRYRVPCHVRRPGGVMLRLLGCCSRGSACGGEDPGRRLPAPKPGHWSSLLLAGARHGPRRAAHGAVPWRAPRRRAARGRQQRSQRGAAKLTSVSLHPQLGLGAWHARSLRDEEEVLHSGSALIWRSTGCSAAGGTRSCRRRAALAPLSAASGALSRDACGRDSFAGVGLAHPLSPGRSWATTADDCLGSSQAGR
jgi:hypothetical protein